MRGRRRTNNWYSILVKIILAFVFFGFVVEELYGFSLYGFSLLLPEQYIPRSSRSNTRSSTLVLCFVFVQCLCVLGILFLFFCSFLIGSVHSKSVFFLFLQFTFIQFLVSWFLVFENHFNFFYSLTRPSCRV